MPDEGRKRVSIEGVKPEIDGGRFPIKRVAGEKVIVQADIFADGHDSISANLLYRKGAETDWQETPLQFLVNDRWQGEFVVDGPAVYFYTIEGWIDHFKTWQKDLRKKFEAGQDLRVDILIGIEHLESAAKRAPASEAARLLEFAGIFRNATDVQTVVLAALGRELGELMAQNPDKKLSTRYGRELEVVVDRKRALFSSWYERFPRSCSPQPDRPGTLRDCEQLIPEIAKMGFDVFYLPPIHPISETSRKGRNNSPNASPGDVGSPWAIGSKEGGHRAIHPQLGTMEDFERLLRRAESFGIEIAMDLAFQCGCDHPYVQEHPEWFRWRPDGTVQYAENPPKKYEDILPLNFETASWQMLWEELKGVVLFWIGKGVRIFRVDNPHTKPFPFWEWLIREIKRDYPDVIFLAEAFTRPKLMQRLAKLGFTQSYTYFTWRNSRHELTAYLEELTKTDMAEYFRPNFWPNTPDILPEHLQYGGRPAFIIRLVLAATLSSSYGVYGPAFELCVSEGLPGREEYANSEKYEIRYWGDLSRQAGNLRDYLRKINSIRRDNPALQTTRNLQFYETENEYLIAYGKATDDLSNIVLVVVNLDPFHIQSGWVKLPLSQFGIGPDQPYLVHDLISEIKYIWYGERNYIELNPNLLPAHILRIRKRLKRETDFDYFV
ncbi:MAG: alpha-1,4-glucan--maltose-1-phosphate maltosyltransferase [bacterium]